MRGAIINAGCENYCGVRELLRGVKITAGCNNYCGVRKFSHPAVISSMALIFAAAGQKIPEPREVLSVS